ncbi:MAG: hypothetical protein IKP95_13045 [Ruminococcus sp.]|nr:hypothetical protein [Ruminococcus sp.]
MSSVTRTIRRGIMFKNMNKQQKLLWRDAHGGIRNNPKKQEKADVLKKLKSAENKEKE